ncbi:hypothetical protein [Virgisporangium aurantiacum]|uniref:Secreted protein n=1 Tax=Virgisporangium aurantiacum TaxID=175570 RepID=A0A8J3ZCY8_9ACTN|nr:hypothetical protein [Virgisporangium aurantiacum]GIJ60528.1 hypothetical protein Vau01_080440 [Virgisporangium aurantiacum]
MKRQILRLSGVAAIAAGGLLLAPVGMAQADANGNRFTHIYQRSTVVCGNAIAIHAVVLTHCDGSARTHDVDLDGLDGLFDLDLDFTGDNVDDDAGQWFHIDSRTWS